MILLKRHSKRNKRKKLEAKHAQLLAGYRMAEWMRKKRVSDLMESQHARRHYHELNVKYKSQYQYIRIQLYRATMTVDRLHRTNQWVTASEHHHIHSIRQYWVDALCRIRNMLHQCQEYMLLFDQQIDDHVAHLTGLDHALATFVMKICQFNRILAPLIKNDDEDEDVSGGGGRGGLPISHTSSDREIQQHSHHHRYLEKDHCPRTRQLNQYPVYSYAQIHPIPIRNRSNQACIT